MYRLTIVFKDVEDLKRKLRELLDQLERSEPRAEAPQQRSGVLRVLFDETVKDVGSIAKRVAREMGMELEVYEVSSSISEPVKSGDSTKVPVSDDLDVLTWSRRLGAILVTGDKKLARTAEAYGVKVVYLPPSGVASKEHYVIEALKRIKSLVQPLPEGS